MDKKRANKLDKKMEEILKRIALNPKYATEAFMTSQKFFLEWVDRLEAEIKDLKKQLDERK